MDDPVVPVKLSRRAVRPRWVLGGCAALIALVACSGCSAFSTAESSQDSIQPSASDHAASPASSQAETRDNKPDDQPARALVALSSATQTTSPEPVVNPATAQPLPAQPPAASPGDTWMRSIDGAEMLFVPAGDFEMGSDNPFYNNEGPPHMVNLPAFWVDRTEITNAQYRACQAAGACKPPDLAGSQPRSNYYDDPEYDSYPVIHVSWYRAVAYCSWVGGRLPSEEEWEYVARGPGGATHPWGDTPDGARLNYCDANCVLPHADPTIDDGFRYTAPVGYYPPGASWCGALDMVGNAWEWVWDWYGYYPSEEHPAWLSSPQSDRVVRGGGWDSDIGHARNTFRNWRNPALSHDSIGFRCVVDVTRD